MLLSRSENVFAAWNERTLLSIDVNSEKSGTDYSINVTNSPIKMRLTILIYDTLFRHPKISGSTSMPC